MCCAIFLHHDITHITATCKKIVRNEKERIAAQFFSFIHVVVVGLFFLLEDRRENIRRMLMK